MACWHEWVAAWDRDFVVCTKCGAILTGVQHAVQQAAAHRAANMAIHHDQEEPIMGEAKKDERDAAVENRDVPTHTPNDGVAEVTGEEQVEHTGPSTPIGGPPSNEPTGAPSNAAHEEERYLQDEARGIDAHPPVGQRIDDEAQVTHEDGGEPFDTPDPQGSENTIDPQRDADDVNEELEEREHALDPEAVDAKVDASNEAASE